MLFHYAPPKKSSGDDRPGGEAFSVISVFCGAFNQKIFVLPSFIFLFFHKDFLYCYELSHDTIPASRSDDNRRAAGAADRSACCSIMPPKKSSGDDRPGGEAFSVISVFCGAFNQKIFVL
ncbi:MAG: hypothetical protein IKP87_04085, partial [Victivallales bacterium]|nr:hypothetical protein [Victivallales bacterium]